MKNLTVILDPAHGSDVLGKCAPDHSHMEYLWSREIVWKLYRKLCNEGYNCFITNEKTTEIGLSARKNFAERIDTNQKKLLISFHNNAAGNEGKWMNARGVEIFTTPNQTASDWIATIFLKTIFAYFPLVKQRIDNSDGDPDKEANFTVLTGNSYYAILIEWLFQDNKEDVALLKDAATNERFIECIIEAIQIVNTKI